jgi:hypothetical protein
MKEGQRISYAEACCIAKETAKRAGQRFKEEVDKEAEEYWKDHFNDRELFLIERALNWHMDHNRYFDSPAQKREQKTLYDKVVEMLKK